MGADCIIGGIRPQIAATIVHLGVHFEDRHHKATLVDAFASASGRPGMKVLPVQQRTSQAEDGTDSGS